jgi:hypothetical protein
MTFKNLTAAEFITSEIFTTKDRKAEQYGVKFGSIQFDCTSYSQAKKLFSCLEVIVEKAYRLGGIKEIWIREG